MEKLKILELFGGIGACSKALEKLGIDYEIADYVEIDKYAVRSYNAMHNTNFEPQDICTWDKDIEVDLIMHGSPCQSISLAGLQHGADKGSGTRSSLMWETVRIVEKLKPKYVIWENVKNLLSKKHIHNFNAYLDTMKELGYKNYYDVLNAKDYGIPQNRERVFTISILDNETEKNENFRSIVKDFIFPPKQELKLKLKDLLEDEVDEKYYLSDKQLNYILDGNDVALKSGRDINNRVVNPTIAKTISCRGAADQRADVTNFTIDDIEEEIKVKEAKLLIKNATKQGWLEATEGDGINISSRMKYHRGNVQKESIQTLTTSGGNDRGVVVSE
jgi:DNA (cytosine-5)-methyltransferase 1